MRDPQQKVPLDISDLLPVQTLDGSLWLASRDIQSRNVFFLLFHPFPFQSSALGPNEFGCGILATHG